VLKGCLIYLNVIVLAAVDGVTIIVKVTEPPKVDVLLITSS
jgi:hypothetical protein